MGNEHQHQQTLLCDGTVLVLVSMRNQIVYRSPED